MSTNDTSASLLSTVEGIVAEGRRIVAELSATDSLNREQERLEAAMVAAGVARYWQRWGEAVAEKRSRLPDSPSGRAATTAILETVIANVATWKEAQAKRKGRRDAAYAVLQHLDPETAAHIGLRVVFQMLAGGITASLSTLCIRIGKELDGERLFRAFNGAQPKLVQSIRNELGSRSRVHHERVVRSAIGRHVPELVTTELSDAELLCTGKAVVEAIAAAGFLTITFKRGTRAGVSLSPECDELVEATHQRAQYWRPEFQPTVIPPRPWTGFRSGGYHYALAGKASLVRRSLATAAAPKNFYSRDKLGTVFAAVNAIQETAWRINSRVLEVFEEAVRLDHGTGGIPQVGLVPVPTLAADIPYDKTRRTPEQEEAVVKYRRLAAAAHQENEDRKSDRKNLSTVLAIAQSYAKYERIYFPHSLDFRGRIYPVATGLHPQGPDYVKALLTFGTSRPITPQNRGLYWLAVHIANCMGECPATGEKLDKGEMDRRVEWTHDNTEMLLAMAADPMGTRDIWTKADSPWQFLAGCFEWDHVSDALLRGETPESSLPVSLDGSCNGLQHFAALLRDERGGAMVNLVPGDKPADVYTAVLHAVQSKLQEIVDAPEKWSEIPKRKAKKGEDTEDQPDERRISPHTAAVRWRQSGQLDRKMVKRPVMTTPYGSKAYGIKGQLLQELRKRGASLHGDNGDNYSECTFLAGIVSQAIGETVISAREAMRWLQAAAWRMSSVGKPVIWEAPTGFPVFQSYPVMAEQRINTFFHGVRFNPLVPTPTNAVNQHQQANAVAPNFVHNLDAAHASLTVLDLKKHGVAAFAMVHDSYGTHAADVELMATSLRRVFVEMYEACDWLEEFAKAVRTALEDHPEELEKLPQLPKHGKLDLKQVLRSPYFFG